MGWTHFRTCTVDGHVDGAASEREASRLPFSSTRISSPAARELRLHELRLLAMRSLHDAEERGRMPPPCTVWYAVCRVALPGVSCSARWPGSAEHARGDGHAWDLARLFVLPRHALATRTRTQRQGTSHVHVVPKSSRAGHHSVPGKWHDC